MEKNKYPGLEIEQYRDGKTRYRVAPPMSKRRRVTITAAFGTEAFDRQYREVRSLALAPDGRMLVERVQNALFDHSHAKKAVSWMLAKARERAIKKGLPFDITKEMLITMVMQQKYKCALSGIEFVMGLNGDASRKPFRPSIDRIDPAKGYTISNIRIVAAIVNIGRSDWSDEVYIYACQRVAALYSGLHGESNPLESLGADLHPFTERSYAVLNLNADS